MKIWKKILNTTWRLASARASRILCDIDSKNNLTWTWRAIQRSPWKNPTGTLLVQPSVDVTQRYLTAGRSHRWFRWKITATSGLFRNKSINLTKLNLTQLNLRLSSERFSLFRNAILITNINPDLNTSRRAIKGFLQNIICPQSQTHIMMLCKCPICKLTSFDTLGGALLPANHETWDRVCVLSSALYRFSKSDTLFNESIMIVWGWRTDQLATKSIPENEIGNNRWTHQSNHDEWQVALLNQ